MPPEPGRLLRLAVRLADGAPVSWDREEETAGTAVERAAIRKLRTLSTLAEFRDDAQDSSKAGNARSHRYWGTLRLEEPIGAGATAEIWLAWEPALQRHVALKLLRRDPVDRRRCLREARLLAKVRHPNVVTVFGAEEHDGRVGVWMEMLDGQTLEEILHARGTYGAGEAALVGIELCRALAAVHRLGLAHGDVKASNVMRAEGGRTVLFDFGCGGAAATVLGDGVPIAGTPLYLAPERLAGEPPSPRSDVYALGVLLFHMVTERFPVEGETVDDLKTRHATVDRARVTEFRDDLPSAFVHVLDRALVPESRTRLPSVVDMERALALVVGGERTPASGEILLSIRSQIPAVEWLALVLASGLVLLAVVAALVLLLLR